jgi:hypothetical protein
MMQKLFDLTGRLRWQPLEHIAQLGVEIKAVELGRVDTGASEQRVGKATTPHSWMCD